MKPTANQSKIVKFLIANPNSDAKSIEKGTSIPRTQVFSTIREMGDQVTMAQKNKKSVQLFSLVSMPSVEKAKAKKDAEAVVAPEPKKNPEPKAAEPKVEEPKAVKKSDKSDGKNFGRDFSMCTLNGVPMRKGKLALGIFKHVVSKMNPTYKQAVEIFDGVMRNGVFTETVNARKINNAGRQRWFTEAAHNVKLKSGEMVSLSNQWSKDNINAMVEVGRKYGCKIEMPTI